jgi:hypothetical protein
VKFGDYTTQMESSLPRRFATAAARTTAMPTPTLNDLTVLDTTPGTVEFWDGTAWVEITRSWVGPNAPTWTPTAGDLWLDTDDVSGGSGVTFPLSVSNGGTSATNSASARNQLMVPAMAAAGSPGPPTAGPWIRGDLWLDSVNVLWVCTVAGTPGTWVSTNRGEELAYAQITAAVSVTATTAATAQTAVTAPATTFDGSAVVIEFSSPQFQTPSSAASASFMINLWDGSTDLGYHGQVITPAAFTTTVPGFIQRRIVPTAGSHTFSIRAWIPAGTGGGSVGAGTGGIGQLAPAYLRITRA